MHRLFVALRPPPPIRSALLALDGTGVPDARWQDDEQLHLTVRFIGDVERMQAEDVCAALAGVRAPAPAVRLDGVGSFDRRGRADTLFARVAPAERLAALHRKVDQALARAAVVPDARRYLPHVTLARLGRLAGDPAAISGWIGAHAGLTSPAFALTHLILYESRLGSEGARYEAVMRWPLD